MKKIKMRCRRALALLLVFTMCMGTMAGTAFAAEDGTTDTAGTEASGDTGNDGGTTSGAESTPSSGPASTSNNDTTSGGTTSGTGTDKAEADGGSDGQGGTLGSGSKAEGITTSTGPTTTTDASGAATTTSTSTTEWKDENGGVVAKKETSESTTVKDDQLQSESKSEEYHQNPTDTTTEVKPAEPEGTEGFDSSANPDGTEGGGTQGETGETGTQEEPAPAEGGEVSSEPETKPEEPGDQVLDVDDWTVVDENGVPVPKEPLLDEEGNPVVDENGEPVYKDGVTVNMTPGESDQKDIVANISKIVEEKIEKELKDREGVEEYNEDGKTGYRYVDNEGEHIIIKVFDPTGKKLIGYETKLIVTTPGSVGPGEEVGAFDPNDPNAPPEWDQPNGAGTVTKIELPERPQTKTDEPDEKGNLVTVEVKELYDVDSNGNIVLDASGQQVVVGYLTTTIVRDANGKQIEGYQKAEWGVRTTVVTNGDTTASTEDKLVVSTSSVSMVTRAITADGYVVDIDSAQMGFVEGSMSTVNPGSTHGNETEKVMAPEVGEPGEGKTDAETDLYNRKDAKYVGYEVNSYDGKLTVRKGAGASYEEVTVLHNGDKIYVFAYEKVGTSTWGRIGKDQWVNLTYAESTYELTGDLTLRSEPGGASLKKWPQKGERVHVLEWKEYNGNLWGKINYGGKTGWISLNSKYSNTEIPPRADKNQYLFLGEYGLESAIKANIDDDTDDDHDTLRPHQFKIWDDQGNALYVYCADLDTKPKEGTDYNGKVSIEEVINSAGSTIWDKNDPENNSKIAKHVQAIASNGFWGTTEGMGSLDKVKEMLKDAIEQKKVNVDGLDITDKAAVERFVGNLTEGMALTATQAAIWSFAASGKAINKEDPFGRYQNNGSIIDWNVDKEKKDVALAFYKYLCGLDPDKAEYTPNKITEDSIKGASITVKSVVFDENKQTQEVADQKDNTANKEYKYSTDVSFILSVKPSQINDDLVVSIFDPKTNELLARRRLAGDSSKDTGFHSGKMIENADGTYTYTIENVLLPEGTNITLRLQGIRATAQAYLIQAKTPDGVDDTTYSQTFVSASGIKQDVDLSLNLTLNVREPVVEIVENKDTTTELISTVERNWKKTSETKYTYKTPEDPKEPDTPDTPNTPNTPNTPSNPPTTRTRRDRSTPISDTPTPLAGIPDDPTPLAMLPEEQVPLAILDEDVPLASVPATGDISGLWYALTLFAGLGLMGMGALNGKKRKDA